MDIVGLIDGSMSASSMLFLYLLASSAVQALPEPDVDGGKVYVFLYRFSHAVVANWKPATKKLEVKKEAIPE